MAPSVAPLHHSAVALLGVPVEIGASRRGTAKGPAALRSAGLISVLEANGVTVTDHGDVSGSELHPLDHPGPPNAKHYREIQAWVRVLSARAYGLCEPGVVPIFLGGDHSLSMGSINGVARYWDDIGRPLFVLWLDAHADFNTPAISPSGNMHGMSAAFLCGEPGFERLLDHEPRVSIAPERMEIFGARSIDVLEQQLLEERRLRVIDMSRIATAGVSDLIRQLIGRVKACNGVLHVSFDVDVLDPVLAPGTGTPVAGGLSVEDISVVMAALRESGLVRSLDVVELNPLRDRRQQTARLVLDLLCKLLGSAGATAAADVMAQIP
ncbi:arginase [Bradyrhizobium sp. 2TAF24]|uniref:arginase n=1 Tax=Bradyrhizobium sp. 2TAF24 TaxID=3233011 RepID=UPI003F938382